MRLTRETCLGNPNPPIFTNNIELKNDELWKEFLDDACQAFKIIEDLYGFDYAYDRGIFRFGFEPNYQYDEYFVVSLDLRNKDNCFISKGISFGSYGSNIVCKTKKYSEYKRKSKFTTFIDKWQPLLEKEFNHLLYF